MNEYCRGMLEALGWVLDLLETTEATPEGLEELRRKIADVIERLVKGAGSETVKKLGV